MKSRAAGPADDHRPEALTPSQSRPLGTFVCHSICCYLSWSVLMLSERDGDSLVCP